MSFNYLKILLNIIALLMLLSKSESLFAGKSNQSIFQDPFDLASGGASLTRASRDGRLFSNPALLPLGAQFNHWLGTRFSVLVDEGGCEFMANPCPASSLFSGSSSEESTTGEEPELFDKVFRRPVRAGTSSSLSWVTSLYGISFFSITNIDIDAKKIGSEGTPEIKAELESFTGLQLAFALRSPVRWLSFGGAVKGVSAFNPILTAGLSQINSGADAIQKELQKSAVSKLGMGGDFGTLLFFQNHYVDYSLALKIDDLGNTKFSESNLISIPMGDSTDGNDTTSDVETQDNLTEFKEVRSVGLGLTFHTGGDQIHFAADFRDVDNVYEEPLFKRVYTGAKITIRSYFGVAMGLYHGRMSWGTELDLFFLKLNFSSFTEERSKKPGLDPRKNFMISISSGF